MRALTPGAEPATGQEQGSDSEGDSACETLPLSSFEDPL